jgi:predicted metal-dependent enzyme (double-stranded beta helix superfamily)
MQSRQAVHSVLPERRAAIAQAVGRVREVERELGVTPEALAEIRAILLELSERRELFPQDDFPPVRDERGFDSVYRLSEDEDHRFALYMSTALPGKKVAPHNHTTWAVIVGVQGNEENFFYERADDGARPGYATLRRIGEEVVRPGSGVCLMPEHIHHIQVTGDQPTLHLHMYGLALDRLGERVSYDVQAGTVKTMRVTPNIREAR